jgi:hypothetical protein
LAYYLKVCGGRHLERWLAGWRVVALGSDVAEEEEEGSDSCGGDDGFEDTRRVYSSGIDERRVRWGIDSQHADVRVYAHRHRRHSVG